MAAKGILFEGIEKRAEASRQSLSSFRFKNTEDALTYGKAIRQRPDEITALEQERDILSRECTHLSLQEIMVALTKKQLLNEALEEARNIPGPPWPAK
ncbi:MAG: hypothetical protein Q8R76_01210 [Candidatus Omnitrophota bacterium]|nr:hypothetical protein [Candidatus Omnitrophota bacterium]